MPSPEPFRIFTRKLEALGLRYMISGGVAAIYLIARYGPAAEWGLVRQ